jgi:predicted RNA-binding Zn-ribbon protein involved in translation (DUF1610 family)
MSVLSMPGVYPSTTEGKASAATSLLMIAPIHTCPICKQIMKLGESTANSTKYFCPSCVQDSTESHYMVISSGQAYVQIIILPPFTIYNSTLTQKSHVHDYSSRKLIFESSFIERNTPEYLVERIRKLIIFS